MVSKKYIIALFLLSVATLLYGRSATTLNPLSFGLTSAKTGEERYWALLKCHQEAIKQNADVSYDGIDTVKLVIPKNAKSIPLSYNTDFSGVVIQVLDTAKKDFVLFKMSQNLKPLSCDISKKAIDRGDFRPYKQLKDGDYILVIKDDSLWVDNRVGYNYGHTRRDVLLVVDGTSVNHPIAPYNTSESLPICSFCRVDTALKTIGNLTILRDSLSTQKCFPLRVENQNNVLIHDIVMITPENDFYGDKAISAGNCTNLKLQNLYIRGSYSRIDKYGYAISLNNLWNTTMENIDADALWGIMGNNNLNVTNVLNCNINRFDIHCYGRDVTLRNSTIRKSRRGWYCGGGSLYGNILIDSCTFYKSNPWSCGGSSYKTQVPHDVTINDCVFYVTKSNNAIISCKMFDDNVNPRPGLSQRNLPNLTVNNLTLIVPKSVDTVYVYNVGSGADYSGIVGNLHTVRLNGIDIVNKDPAYPAQLVFSNIELNTERKVNYVLNFKKSNRFSLIKSRK